MLEEFGVVGKKFVIIFLLLLMVNGGCYLLFFLISFGVMFVGFSYENIFLVFFLFFLLVSSGSCVSYLFSG